MMKIIKIIRLSTVTTPILFAFASWVLLYFWLSLVHSVDQKVAATAPASPEIYACIALSFFFLIIQDKPGALRELAIVTFCVFTMLVFIAFAFYMQKNSKPDIYDIIFYYECFLMVFFSGVPIYLSTMVI